MNKYRKLLFFPIFLFLLFIFRSYYQRIGAFGCFDDCFNIVAGHFIGSGKTLYSQIFFNHQPLMAYISFIIQEIHSWENIYQLILAHRLFIIGFALLMDVLIITRFRAAGLAFVLIFESTKFYIFGDRFLAEAVIVYPLVYMLGLVWQRLGKKTVFSWELIAASLFTWFVIFMREPFVPLAIVLFTIIIWSKKGRRIGVFSIFLLFLLTVATIFTLPLADYFFNVININTTVWIKTDQIPGTNIIKIFAYPLYLIVNGDFNFFRPVLIGLSITFLISGIAFALLYKKPKQVLLILFILGLANLRVVPPAFVFYESFHMIPWYGLFIMTTALFVSEAKRHIRLFCLLILGAIFIYSIASPQSFIQEKINTHEEFTVNYGRYFAYGQVIKTLASSTDTLFVDGFDELIQWQANIPSSYKYSWYTSVMPRFPVYVKERREMFLRTPPVFYYGNCPEDKNTQRLLPDEVQNDYARLYFAGRPTCLHIYKSKLNNISREKWDEIKKYEFYLPSL